MAPVSGGKNVNPIINFQREIKTLSVSMLKGFFCCKVFSKPRLRRASLRLGLRALAHLRRIIWDFETNSREDA